jgi:cobaltochelatase CobN
MKSVACLINAAGSEMLLEGLAAFQKEFGRRFRTSVSYAHEVEEERVCPEAVRSDLETADLVLLDIRGTGRAATLASSALAGTTGDVVVLMGGSLEVLALVRMGAFSMREILQRRQERESSSGDFDVQRVQGILRWVERAGSVLPMGRLRHIRNWNRAMRYWTQGGTENVKNLFTFLGREYLGLRLPRAPAPVEQAAFGIFDPLSGTFFNGPSAYRDQVGYDPSRPTVGLLFYGGMHMGQSLAGARALAERLQGSCNLLPLYAGAGSNLEALRNLLPGEDGPLLDALVYFQWFQLATFSGEPAGGTVELLKQLDAPLFDATPMFGREIEAWRASEQGLSPVEIMTAVILPELDGMIEPVPLIGMSEREHPATGQLLKAATAIEPQIDFTAARIRRRVALRRKPNGEKRVAFILYNQPPGEDNIGNASCLDVFASLRRVLGAMRERGYAAGEMPDGKALCERLIATGAVNQARWVPEGKSLEGAVTLDEDRYREIWGRLPDPGELVSAFGDPPGEIMAGRGRVILPVVELGNVLVGLQPSRGLFADPEAVTHDKTLPPHHQYVAFYRWVEEDWKADAVVHVGTHGTIEFLKGKEAGMSASCYPLALLGSVPHFYIYHVVNASEAVIAKRRSLATLINHNSPPLTVSGLYEQYVDLEDLVNEYQEARFTDPGRAGRVESKIGDLASELNLRQGSVPEIQEEIARLKRTLIPRGLHVLDEERTDEELAETVTAFLRYDRGETPSLHRLLAESDGLDYDRLLEAPSVVLGEATGARHLERIEDRASALVRATLAAREPAGEGKLEPPLRLALDLAGRLQARREIPGLLGALEGRYTEPGIGGEPCRDPDVLPTGRNSYQFDPRLVPSEAAYERGKEIAENTLGHYRTLHGRYPQSVGVILWGFETAKTRGETVGQVFGYLGVRPVRKTPWKTEIRVIPLEELGRPRVDVTVNICGFFRDMFMNVVQLINHAFAVVSDLDEAPSDNFVRPHTDAAHENLQEELGPSLARKVAASRIFGPRPGEYGTPMTALVEAGSWKSEEELVRAFTESMNHLYADNVHGRRVSDVYAERLGRVEMVSQIRDTLDFEIADLDHYYEFFGGLARTIESIRGRPPVQLITDTTGERVRTETVGESLARGLRSRLLNPKWIEGMLEHEVHGAQKISDRVGYLIGFAATTHAVENWVWSSITERYVVDEEMFRRLVENNRFAAEAVLRRLFEAEGRGYWRPSPEERQSLKQRYLELEGLIEASVEG